MAFGKRPERTNTTGDLRAASEYYKLNTRAVDDLVSADESNSPPVSEEELKKYRSGSKLKLSAYVKAVLIKFWFYGSVCFFILWGLGIYVRDQLDMLLILGIAMGLVTDLLTNSIFRFYANTPGENDRFMMFPRKQYMTFFYNILYHFVVLFFVYTTYNVINALLVGSAASAETVPLGVGPILFGVFSTFYDMLFIKMKLTAKSILRDAKNAR